MQPVFCPDLTDGQWSALRAAYADPPRAYHGWDHVLALWRLFEDVATDGPGWRQPAEVWWAIAFHDAVYLAGRSDNEAASARLARAWLPQWAAGRGMDLARIEQLIMLTARHGQLRADEVDADAALFLDCDMAILAAAPAQFDAYDRGIAAEYLAVVPAGLYLAGRQRFLQGLLAQPRIYLSDYFHRRLDASARANLARAAGA